MERFPRAALAVAGAVVLIVSESAIASAAPVHARGPSSLARPRVSSNPTVLGWGFDEPQEVVADSAHLWIENANGNYVSELSLAGAFLGEIPLPNIGLNPFASLADEGGHLYVGGNNSILEYSTTTGALIQSIKGAAYHFNTESAIVGNGKDMWALDLMNGSITKFLTSSGSFVKLFKSASYHFDQPNGVALIGGQLWVTNGGNSSITIINATTGSLVRLISKLSFFDPGALASNGKDVWLTGGPGAECGYVELSVATGKVVRSINGELNFKDQGAAIAIDGNGVFLACPSLDAVTEYSATSGAVVKRVRGAPYKFDGPDGLVVSGSHAWVSNYDGASVTEFAVPTGSLVAVRTGSPYGFDQPAGDTSNGTDVWVANSASDSVTEVSATTGALVRVFDAAKYDFVDPQAIDAQGADVWVASGRGGPVVELSAATGALVRVIHSSDFGQASAILVNGGDVWVTNETIGTLTELNAANGSVVRSIDVPASVALATDGTDIWVGGGSGVTELAASNASVVRSIKGSSYELSMVSALATDGSDLWIASQATNSVTEVSEATGALMRIVKGSSFDLQGPYALVVAGADVWVADCGGYCLFDATNALSSVTEFQASNGALVQVLSGASYGFDATMDLTITGGQAFVTNDENQSVTQFPT